MTRYFARTRMEGGQLLYLFDRVPRFLLNHILVHITLQDTFNAQLARKIQLPSWAAKQQKYFVPVPTTQCLSEIIRDSSKPKSNFYLPYRDFGEHPVVVVTKTPDHYDKLHKPTCDVPCYHVKESGWDHRYKELVCLREMKLICDYWPSTVCLWADLRRADGFMNILYIADFPLPSVVQCAKTQRNYQGTIEGPVNYPHLYNRVSDRVC